jgi:hypothetical protein
LFQPENPKPRKKQRSVKQQTGDLPPSVSKLVDLFQPENPKPRKKQRSVKQQTGDLPPSVSKLVDLFQPENPNQGKSSAASNNKQEIFLPPFLN